MSKLLVVEITGMVVSLAGFVAVVYLFVLTVRALRKYLRSRDAHGELAAQCKTLGDARQAERTRCNMTQEFVAHSLGVSRQAVREWERGASAPSASNLLALVKLYGVSAEELLQKAE